MDNYQDLRASIVKRAEKTLKPSRYRHTLGVETAAIALARYHGADEEDASIAALLHDIAKQIPYEKSMQWLEGTETLQRYPDLGDYPQLLHAFVGAEVSHHDYPELSDDIIQAIRHHTTGRPEMSRLEKIIFAADYIEPGREPFPGQMAARERTFEDLNQGVLLIMKQTVEYIESSGGVCYQLTKDAYQFMLETVGPKSVGPTEPDSDGVQTDESVLQ